MANRRDFATKPVANPAAVVGGESGQKYRFTVLREGVIRYEWADDDQFEDRASTFAINREQPVPEFRVIETERDLKIITKRIHLTYVKGLFSVSSLMAQVLGKVTNWHSEWRFGNDDPGLGGTARTLDEADGRIPLGPGVCSRRGFVALDDSKSMLFESNGWVGGRRPGSRIDGYLFAYGLDFKDAVRALYAISGPQPLLPRWALGNWWSRYYRYHDSEYLALMDRFKEENIPLCVSVLDMDWHYVNDARVSKAGVSGWTGYTWDEDVFPEPERFCKDIHDRGLKITLNDHPADGVASYEQSYHDMAKALGKDTSDGDSIPFDIADEKFTDAYFDILLRKLEDQGVDFWWIDWQQGEHSRVVGVDPLWMLNHYHFLDGRRDNRRPLAFSRYAGPGSHRYPVGFSGDTVVSWESLDFQPEFTATASNIGYGWWSHDIGGHFHGYRDDELAARWVQLGTFSPILRLHSSNNPWNSKEPWGFVGESRDAMNQALRLRHRLIPYLYSVNVKSCRENEPLVQPMYWEYPMRDEAYGVKNQFFFGSELMVVPLTSPRDKVTRMARTKAWLPPGRHVDIFTGVVYDGDCEKWMYRGLDEYLVLAKESAVFPLDAADAPGNGAYNPESMEVNVIVGADGSFDIFEDDGSGSSLEKVKWIKTPVTYSQKSGTVTIGPVSSESGGKVPSRKWSLRLPGFQLSSGEKVTVGGKDAKYKTSAASSGTVALLELKDAVDPGDKIEIILGKEPQLAITDASSHIYNIVNRAQMMFDPKQAIWAAVTAKAPLGVRISRIYGLDLDETLKEAILEYLLADSRAA